mmetsp:Transcript_1628/g.3586  ORF Transcript_1628/g.3586 Transcript_1628/m.3586 type:complete len:359 (-) Transcript_1628:195-1271(-)
MRTLYILLGDSLDRQVVEALCARQPPEALSPWAPRLCLKCLLCERDLHGDGWLNVMLFGLDVQGCRHSRGAQQESMRSELLDPSQRVSQLVKMALSSNITSTFERIHIQLHSGLWDLYGLSGCRAAPRLLGSGDSYPREWLAASERNLLQPVFAAIGDSPATSRSKVQQPLMWRTLPFTCRRFADNQDVSALVASISSMGSLLACRSGLIISDWRAVACRTMRQSIHLTDDAVHYTTNSSAKFALASRQAAARAEASVHSGNNKNVVGTACSEFPPTADADAAISRAASTLVHGKGWTAASCECERCDNFYLVLPAMTRLPRVDAWSLAGRSCSGSLNATVLQRKAGVNYPYQFVRAM